MSALCFLDWCLFPCRDLVVGVHPTVFCLFTTLRVVCLNERCVVITFCGTFCMICTFWCAELFLSNCWISVITEKKFSELLISLAFLVFLEKEFSIITSVANSCSHIDDSVFADLLIESFLSDVNQYETEATNQTRRLRMIIFFKLNKRTAKIYIEMKICDLMTELCR